MHPPNPQTNRAALADGPARKTNSNTADIATERTKLQERHLVRLYAVMFAAAAAIARLVYGVVR
jgi:hypothetical protein